MNLASWIILAILLIWVVLAIRAAFFKKKRGHRAQNAASSSAPDGRPAKEAVPAELLNADDDAFHVDIPECGGCDKNSCASCPLARGDIPMPTIHELK